MDMSTPYSPKPLVNATCKLGDKGCYKNGRCHYLGNCENKITSNADQIRAMSDRELASFLAKHTVSESNLRLIDQGYHPTATEIEALRYQVEATWMRWLRQPSEDCQCST